MTADSAAAPAPGATRRRWWAVSGLILVGWAILRAGYGRDVVNERGWDQFSAFWRAAASPELAADFLDLTVDAAATTLAYAVLGTALSVGLGVIGGLASSRRLWELDEGGGRSARVGWLVARIALVAPRAVHEVLWAILAIQVLGFDPLVAIIAIGVPFGAVTAKVYAEILDEADPRPYRALRAAGAGRVSAFAYGLVPVVAPDLVSYTFYRLECAVRSAAILGVIGAGGIGYQIDLSFRSLRYEEIWTLILALVVLSGVADAWSSAIRRRHAARLPDGSRARRLPTSRRDPFLVGSVAALVALVVVSWVRLDIDITHLWSGRTRTLGPELVRDLFPPRLGPGGWSELLRATVDTLAMSVLALVVASTGGLVIALAARRRPGGFGGRSVLGGAARLAALVLRAVPPILWAFIVVLVVFPGIWAGALALGVYNMGVLARLYAEILEDLDPRPQRALVASGATPTQVMTYAVVPAAASRLAAMSLYRWEVLLRESVVVGVVGAGGIGRLVQTHLTARDFHALLGAILALAACTAIVDTISARVRRDLR